LNSNPNFKNYSKYEFGHKSKVVECRFLSNFGFWEILGFNEKSEVIFEISKMR
jgi:hypothetical protein